MHTLDPEIRRETADLCLRLGATGFTVGWQGECTKTETYDVGWWAQTEYGSTPTTAGTPVRVEVQRSPNAACLALAVALLKVAHTTGQDAAGSLAEQVPAALETLRGLREARGLTQAEVADRMGTRKSAVAALESGDHRPTLALLEQYAAAVGCRLRLAIEPDGQP